jgi:hypothetical protein
MTGNGNQLSQVIDRVNDAFFWGEKLTRDERGKLARLIAATHGRPGAYANTFALSEAERARGIRLFTGEPTASAAARHITGEEACRALRLLNVRDPSVMQALNDAAEGLQQCLMRSEQSTEHRMGGNPGTFCCGRCSVSVWRHILAGGFDRREERLHGAMTRLKDFRDGKGRWAIFPFWYALSALVEIELPQARQEIRYAAAILERAAKRSTPSGEYERRRTHIARRALARL